MYSATKFFINWIKLQLKAELTAFADTLRLHIDAASMELDNLFDYCESETQALAIEFSSAL